MNSVNIGKALPRTVVPLASLYFMTFSDSSQSVLPGESRSLDLDVIKIEDPYTHPELELYRSLS